MLPPMRTGCPKERKASGKLGCPAPQSATFGPVPLCGAGHY